MNLAADSPQALKDLPTVAGAVIVVEAGRSRPAARGAIVCRRAVYGPRLRLCGSDGRRGFAAGPEGPAHGVDSAVSPQALKDLPTVAGAAIAL